MKRANRSNIKELLRQGKDIVIELDDEVEYIINESALNSIEEGQERVPLVRVIDGESRMISARRIMWAISKEGVVDYLDKK